MNKIFDSTFRTLCEKSPRLLIPLVNECFNKNYSFDEKIDLLSGEHHIMPNAETDDTEEIITDSCIRVCDKLYHIECQSTDDGTMILRMVEYDFFIALEHAEKNEMVRKGAESIMGGVVLETLADKKLAEGEDTMKRAMLLIFQDGINTVDGLVANGIPLKVAKKALENL